ncbi:MAG TPA: hypothetical protein PLV59_01720 [Candidatus Dojkabacteria bacterium]|nr:hypothetical protein [Candidatus Dojkabacteria bacterium]
MKQINQKIYALLHHISSILKKIDTNKVAIVIITLVFILLFALSFTRNSVKDENLYLRETMVMAEVLKDGQWFGNHGVGVHGFIFKLPVALIFMITGPNVLIATLFTLILSLLSAIFFFKILREHFKLNGWALAGLLLFIMGFEFVRTTPTYLRDIPALFTVILFIYYFFKKKNNWILGLILLLMMDAKEHVFYMIGSGYALWIVLDGIKSYDNWLHRIQYIVVEGFKAFFPVLVYQILMFTTGIIPINMFNASILGLIETGAQWAKKNFSVNVATSNLVADEASREIFQISTASIKERLSASPTPQLVIWGPIETILEWVNVGLRYLGKISYPRSFSFISIPKIVIAPALTTSVIFFFKWIKTWDRNRLKVMLVMIFWSYLFIYVFRSSHGRYLLSITPVVIIFFIIFLRNVLYNTKVARGILIATSLYILLGLYFELTFVWHKALINVVLVSLLALTMYLHTWKSKLVQLSSLIFVVALGIATTGTSLVFSWQLGQLSEYNRWGANHQVEKVVEAFPPEDTIFLNQIGWDQLPSVYRYDMGIQPEWKWQLKEELPKNRMLVVPPKSNTHVGYLPSISSLYTFVVENDIDRVGIVKSELPDYPFLMQEHIPTLQTKSWAVLEKTVKIKNAQLYIFKMNIENDAK